MTYGELKTLVATTLGKSDLTSQIPYFIGSIADELMSEHNFSFMEAQAYWTLEALTAGTTRGEGQAIAYPPTDWTHVAGLETGTWKAIRDAWLYDSEGKRQFQLVICTAEQFDLVVEASDSTVLYTICPDIKAIRSTGTEGDPLIVTDYGEELRVYPQISSGAVGKMLYVKHHKIEDFTALDAGDERTLIDWGWRALLYGACMEAQPFLGNDDRIKRWSDLYDRGKDSLMKKEYAKVGSYAR